MKTNIKTLVLSLSLIASANAFAGLGGLNVQSNLGEPFSGSIVVTDKEAQALIQSGTVQVTGHNISGTVVPQSNGNAIVRLRSNTVINDPIIRFEVKAGKQLRQYSAMMSPASYRQHSTPTIVAEKQHTTTNNTNKTPVEKASIEKAPVEVKKASKPKKTHKSPVIAKGKGSYHRVQAGETVSILADRYRPQNMTHAQAVQAIIAANPRVFAGHSNGHLLYKDISIYIPFKSPTAPDVQTNAGTTSTLPETQSPAVVEPANNATASSVATQNAAETASIPASSAPVAAASETATASTTTASEATNASAPVASVESKPVAPPKTTPTVEETEDSSILSDLPWSSLGLGAAAILGLGGLALALRRRKNRATVAEYEEDEDDLELEEDDIDLDDDEIDLTATEAVENSEDDDDIDIIEEITPVTPKAAATHTEQNIVETLKTDDTVIINETLEDEDDIDDFIITEVITPQSTSTTPNVEESSLTDTSSTSTDDSDNLITTATVGATTLGAAVAASAITGDKEANTDQTDNWLDNYLAFDEETTTNTPSTQIEHQNTETQDFVLKEEKTTEHADNTYDFELKNTLDFTTEDQNESPSAVQAAVQENDSDFLNFVLEDEPVQQVASSDKQKADEIALDSDIAPSAEAVSIQEIETKKAATQSNVSTDSIREDWLNVTETPDPIDSAGFVSEAVGMAAPLEAKLELAKMYLEIDDAVAARETLRELIEESTGNIQQAAQQLLTELGG